MRGMCKRGDEVKDYSHFWTGAKGQAMVPNTEVGTQEEEQLGGGDMVSSSWVMLS